VDCQTCRAIAGEISLTLGPRIDLDEHWLIEHSHPVSTVGWLVAEGPGFHHVHVHLMARTADWPIQLRGPKVFDAFGAQPHVDAADQTAIVASIRAALGL
jgi:hypothetical protein